MTLKKNLTVFPFVILFAVAWLFFGPVSLCFLCIGLLQRGESDPLPVTTSSFVLMGIVASVLSLILFALLSMNSSLLVAVERLFSLRLRIWNTPASSGGPDWLWFDRYAVGSEISSMLLAVSVFLLFTLRPGSFLASAEKFWEKLTEAGGKPGTVRVLMAFVFLVFVLGFYLDPSQTSRLFPGILFYPAASIFSLLAGPGLISYHFKRVA